MTPARVLGGVHYCRLVDVDRDGLAVVEFDEEAIVGTGLRSTQSAICDAKTCRSNDQPCSASRLMFRRSLASFIRSAVAAKRYISL